MQCNNKFGAFLETFQKIDYQIPDILCVGTLERELLGSDCRECEGLRKCLTAPERIKNQIIEMMKKCTF